jgi:hypothetical protein
MALSVGLSHLIGVLHFIPYKASNGLIFNDVDTHFDKKTQPNEGSLPTWKVDPLHTFLTYLQLFG